MIAKLFLHIVIFVSVFQIESLSPAAIGAQVTELESRLKDMQVTYFFTLLVLLIFHLTIAAVSYGYYDLVPFLPTCILLLLRSTVEICDQLADG